MRSALWPLHRPLLVCFLLSVSIVALCACGHPCEAESSPSVLSQLFIAGGHVYLYSQGTGLLVLQEGSGKLLWRTNEVLEALDAQQLYLRDSPDGYTTFLDAVRPSDGKRLWQFKETDTTSVQRAAEGSVYLYDWNDGSLMALSSSDGKERWKKALTFPPGITGGSETRFASAMQVSDSVVYVHTSFGQISAYQAQSGTLLWSQTLPGDSTNTLADLPWQISAGVIYLTTRFQLYALRESDGQVLWKHDGTPAFAVDSASGILWNLQARGPADSLQLTAVQAQTGQVLWQRAEPQLQNDTSPLGLKRIGGILYSGTRTLTHSDAPMNITYFRETISAIRASDGLSLWQYHGQHAEDTLEIEGTETTAFLLSVYFPDAQPSTKLLAAVRVSDGTRLWQQKEPASGLAVADGVLYTGYGGDGATDGCKATGAANILKYRATDGQVLWHVQP